MRTKRKLWGSISSTLSTHLNRPPHEKAKRGRERQLDGEAICEVELGLYLLSYVLPDVPVQSLWVLMAGYDFPLADLQSLSADQRRCIGTVRHILLHFKSARRWQDALEQYRNVDERFRLYEIDEALEHCTHRTPSVCSDREELYERLMHHALPHTTHTIQWAIVGQTYLCFDRHKQTQVAIPADLPLPLPPSGHLLHGRVSHPPLIVPWGELLSTAQWMDEESERRQLSPRHWRATLHRVRLRVSSDENSPFLPTEGVHFEQTKHFVGMVSSGKSTLMDVLAVWAARNGRHITLVVGDVMAVFDRVQLFIHLGLKVAPLVGSSNRRKHRNRLHRVLFAQRTTHPLLQQHVGFDYTSSACLLDGLREGARRPFQMDPQPCLHLALPSEEEEAEESTRGTVDGGGDKRNTFACPFYNVCPYHQAQRDLVDASIWVGTPASLVYTYIDSQLNPDRLRFIELVYRRSDLIVVDEADRVQVQFDHLFSPSLTLMSRGRESWLGSLQEKVAAEVSREGLAQFQYEQVNNWDKALRYADGALHNVYAFLLTKPALQTWIEKERDYFSGLTLLEKLTIDLSGVPIEQGKSPFDHHLFQEFWHPFSTFLDDPLGEKKDNNHELADLARQIVAVHDRRVEQRLSEWIQKQPIIPLEAYEVQDYAIRLGFALMLEVLSNRLDALMRDWKEVEVILGLEGRSSALFYSPPEDYAPLLPDAPMGNILGFQYLRSTQNLKDPGELRFFRCMGVGRWLLLHLHDIFAADNIAGPHALLLSGTSWAGTAPGYHVQLPVTGVLLAPDQEVKAINTSSFQLSLQWNRQRQPISISGKQGLARTHALEEMLHELSREDKVGETRLPSVLEEKKSMLPEGRQRVLLLVGSYVEAEHAHRFLLKQRPDWEGQTAYLVPDDAEFESEWHGNGDLLHRGLVDQFARTGAWLLIAPLLAIERGHNILNDEKMAAIGAAYFLVRPHPRPDDINYVIHSINRWALEKMQDRSWLLSKYQEKPLPLNQIGHAFRRAAFGRWRQLLRQPLKYSTLNPYARKALVWNQLVSIWQVIGRLVRGGCPAEVFFCDAKFAPRTANLSDDDETTSLIMGMKEVLTPYFDEHDSQDENGEIITRRKKDLVRILYGPFYQGLVRMEGMSE